LAGDFAPGFLVRHLLKDIRLAREAAEADGVELPGLVVAEQLYEVLSESGGGDAGTQALYALYGLEAANPS
jgi:3-hydroxyisobutyrate dehydrogenase